MRFTSVRSVTASTPFMLAAKTGFALINSRLCFFFVWLSPLDVASFSKLSASSSSSVLLSHIGYILNSGILSNGSP